MHASQEALTLARPACEVRVFKRHGVGGREGELGADLTSIVMPRNSPSWQAPKLGFFIASTQNTLRLDFFRPALRSHLRGYGDG